MVPIKASEEELEQEDRGAAGARSRRETYYSSSIETYGHRCLLDLVRSTRRRLAPGDVAEPRGFDGGGPLSADVRRPAFVPEAGRRPGLGRHSESMQGEAQAGRPRDVV